jgi:hypothetical protein
MIVEKVENYLKEKGFAGEIRQQRNLQPRRSGGGVRGYLHQELPKQFLLS